MKKSAILTAALLSCVGAAHGALTKCVYLAPGMTCTASKNPSEYENKADWDAMCSDTFGSSTLNGVWRCGNQNGSTQGTTTDMLSTAYSATSNTYCWCKMTIPAVSQWVFHSNVGDQGTCHGTCGRLCIEALQTAGSTAFKTAMFNDLGA